MEAALALVTLVGVLALCVAGLVAIGAKVRCLDAAREAARLAARGDERVAAQVVAAVAPRGARMQVRHDGDFVVVSVAARSALLPGVRIDATAVAAVEPGD